MNKIKLNRDIVLSLIDNELLNTNFKNFSKLKDIIVFSDNEYQKIYSVYIDCINFQKKKENKELNYLRFNHDLTEKTYKTRLNDSFKEIVKELTLIDNSISFNKKSIQFKIKDCFKDIAEIALNLKDNENKNIITNIALSNQYNRNNSKETIKNYSFENKYNQNKLIIKNHNDMAFYFIELDSKNIYYDKDTITLYQIDLEYNLGKNIFINLGYNYQTNKIIYHCDYSNYKAYNSNDLDYISKSSNLKDTIDKHYNYIEFLKFVNDINSISKKYILDIESKVIND